MNRDKTIEALSGPKGLLEGLKVTYCQPTTKVVGRVTADVESAYPGRMKPFERPKVSVYRGRDTSAGDIHAVIITFIATGSAKASTGTFVALVRRFGYTPVRYQYDPVSGRANAVFLLLPGKEAV